MRWRSGLVAGAVLLSLSVTGCATETAREGAAEATGSAGAQAAGDPAARAQAQAWLDAAALPPGATPADASVAEFTSYTGWPCGPIEEREAFWSVPGATVAGTANWLRENPTADLLSTAGAAIPEDSSIDGATVGFIPEWDTQEGVVYTIAKTEDGVAVRAEIAALTASATCRVCLRAGAGPGTRLKAATTSHHQRARQPRNHATNEHS